MIKERDLKLYGLQRECVVHEKCLTGEERLKKTDTGDRKGRREELGGAEFERERRN